MREQPRGNDLSLLLFTVTLNHLFSASSPSSTSVFAARVLKDILDNTELFTEPQGCYERMVCF